MYIVTYLYSSDPLIGSKYTKKNRVEKKKVLSPSNDLYTKSNTADHQSRN